MELEDWAGVSVSRPADGVLLVTLQRPERLNALTVAIKRDLTELFIEAQLDDETRAIVLTGAGRAFCAGDYVHADYTRERPGHAPLITGGHTDAASTYSALKAYSQGLNRALRAIDKPTIAAVNGAAIQSGLSLALACDFRYQRSCLSAAQQENVHEVAPLTAKLVKKGREGREELRKHFRVQVLKKRLM